MAENARAQKNTFKSRWWQACQYTPFLSSKYRVEAALKLGKHYFCLAASIRASSEDLPALAKTIKLYERSATAFERGGDKKQAINAWGQVSLHQSMVVEVHEKNKDYEKGLEARLEIAETMRRIAETVIEFDKFIAAAKCLERGIQILSDGVKNFRETDVRTINARSMIICLAEEAADLYEESADPATALELVKIALQESNSTIKIGVVSINEREWKNIDREKELRKIVNELRKCAEQFTQRIKELEEDACFAEKLKA